MRALSESRFLRYLVFSALYFAQGIPWGFIGTGYVVFLADQGLDNTAVTAAIGIAYLPWSFKIIWGPLIDRFPSLRFGRRRPFIIGAQILMGVTLLVLPMLDPKQALTLISAVLFLHNTFAALQDVAVDGLAVDLLPLAERGSVNSVMWAAKLGGVALGGGGGTLVAKYLGWPALFMIMAGMIWAIMLMPILIRERPAVAPGLEEPPPRLDFNVLKRSFSFAAPLMGIVIALLTPLGYGMIGTFTTRMLRAELGLSEEIIATVSGVVEPISGVAGALLGGLLADRLGIRRMVGVYMGAIALAIVVWGLNPGSWGSIPFLIGWTIALNLAINAYNAATLGFYMTLCNPAIGATQFAVYMASTNLCYAFAVPAGGWMADNLGYTPTYLIAATVQLLTIPLLMFCDPRTAEARFRGENDAASASSASAT